MTRSRARAASIALCAACLASAFLVLVPRSAVIDAIHVYQRRVSPAAVRLGIRCRFTPTCSRYAEIVIARDGVVRGGWKTLKRVSRCGPWTPAGTIDAPD